MPATGLDQFGSFPIEANDLDLVPDCPDLSTAFGRQGSRPSAKDCPSHMMLKISCWGCSCVMIGCSWIAIME
jgi:hypothetical protein